MKAAVVSVGTELLFGQVVNTNAAYISEKLNNLGIDVYYHYTVGDNPGRLKDILNLAFKVCDLIITTGGLGPTEDDLTKEIVCEFMGDELVLHQPTMDAILAYRGVTGRKLTQNNYKQAYLPSKATVFANDQGTAPGIALDMNDRIAICLPGPPREMKSVFEKGVIPYLSSKSEDVIYYRQIRCFHIGESQLETELLPLIDSQTDPTIATYAKEGECAARVASKRKTLEEAKNAVDEVCAKIGEIVGEYIYSYDDEELPQVVCRNLMEQKITVSSAEYGSGGMFIKAMTDIPSTKDIFERGIVIGSRESAVSETGASEEAIKANGMVSSESVIEMAKGLKAKTGSTLAIAAACSLNEAEAKDDEPVGTIYIAIAYGDQVEVRKELTSRPLSKVIRNYTMLNMFDFINKTIAE